MKQKKINTVADPNRLIIDTIPTMAWTVLPDGSVDFANQRWLDYAGNAAFEHPNEIIHPEDLPGVMKNWMKHKETGTAFEDEMRLRGADGEYRWFLVRTAPLKNKHGKIVKWYGVSFDIEDSKVARDNLRLAYQSLSYHFENTPLAVIEWDKDMTVKKWSARAEQIFGWTASECIGKNPYNPDFPLIYQEDISAVSKVAGQLSKGDVDNNVCINRNYNKDGNIIYCEWYNSVLRDKHGEVVTILSLAQDVTDRIESEETLKHSYQKIRRLTEHLRNIREEERTRIAREIHDELGGQLTVLKMDAFWLNLKLADQKQDITERIRDHIDILTGMLKSVRRISSELRSSDLDNVGLITAIKWHMEDFEKRSGIRAVFYKPTEKLEIPDPIKNGLFCIFKESLTNVARHADAKNVKVELVRENDQLILRIADDGKGFDLPRTNRKRNLGILGMKERTSLMGGNYKITGMPGKGTTVTVVLNLARGGATC